MRALAIILKARIRTWACVPLLVAMALIVAIAPAPAQEPIKIGFSVSLTGGLASSGKAHLLSKQIWLEEINAKGGLLGRPVKLVYYDDQTNAATVPGIYAKLIDIDKVDLLMGAATNLIVAAMPHDHGTQEDGHGAAGARLERRVQISEIFPERAVRAGPQGRAVERIFRGRQIAQSGAEDGRAGRRGCRVLQQRADRRARECQASSACRSSTTAAIRPPRSITRRSCAPSRRPIPTWCCWHPIRRIRSAWCVPRPRSG